MFADTLADLLAGDHRVWVFSQFVDHLKLVEAHLKQQAVTYQYLDGSTTHAARRDREAGRDLDSIVSQAYLLAAGRPPTEDEALIARDFLADNSLREFALAMFNLNSFLYLN